MKIAILHATRDLRIEDHHRGEEGQRDRCQQRGPPPHPLGLVAGNGWLGSAHHYGRVTCSGLLLWHRRLVGFERRRRIRCGSGGHGLPHAEERQSCSHEDGR